MNPQKQDKKATVLQKILATLPKGKDPAAFTALKLFSEEILSTMALEDLEESKPENLCGMLQSLWSCVQKRQKNEAIVHIFNPQSENSGWESSHTIVEIAHEDAPFLVDSVLMELNRQGFHSHLMIHAGG